MDPLFVTVSSEYLSYDWEAAAGDFGGMLGMLLGASCLALYDSIAIHIAKLRKLLKTQRGI